MQIVSTSSDKFAPFIFTLSFFALLLILAPGHYATNDDIELINILSGADGFYPNAETTYLSHFLSHTLFFLYKFFPDAPWFGATVYLATFIGSYLTFGVIIRNTINDKITRIVYLPLLFAFFGYLILFLSFTSATLILLLGAILSFTELCARNALETNNKLYIGILIFSLFFAFSLRWKLSLYFSVISLPLVFFADKSNIRTLLFWLAVFACFLFTDRVILNLETNANQLNYLEYNSLRAKFHDTASGNNHGDVTQNALDTANWTMDDYTFFRYWILYDDVLFNTERLEVFLDFNSIGLEGAKFQTIRNRVKSHLESFADLNSLFIAGLLSLFLYKIIYKKDLVSDHLLPLSLFITLAFSCLLFLLFYRYVPRVFLPFFPFILGLLSLVTNGNSGTPTISNQHTRLILIATITLLSITAFIQICTVSSNVLTDLHTHKREIAHTNFVFNHVDNKRDEETVVVMLFPVAAGNPNLMHANPLRESSLHYENLKIFPIGTSINSPRYFNILHKYNLRNGHEFLEWTINNENVIFVLFARNNFFTRTIKSTWERYFIRNITPEKARLKLLYDYRNKKGVGLVFFSMIGNN